MFTLLRYWMPMHCIDSSLQETVFQYLQIWPPFFSKKKMKLWRTTIWSSAHTIPNKLININYIISNVRRIFVDSRTGRVYEEGDILKRERLAELVCLLNLLLSLSHNNKKHCELCLLISLMNWPMQKIPCNCSTKKALPRQFPQKLRSMVGLL